MTILEMWLGKVSRSEAAKRLEVSQLRLSQLSQQSVSGMMAGLLKQPRCRVPKGALDRRPAPENDPNVLRRRVARLSEDLLRTENLVRVLQEIPMPRVTPGQVGKERPHADRNRRRAKTSGVGGDTQARGKDPASKEVGS